MTSLLLLLTLLSTVNATIDYDDFSHLGKTVDQDATAPHIGKDSAIGTDATTTRGKIFSIFTLFLKKED